MPFAFRTAYSNQGLCSGLLDWTVSKAGGENARIDYKPSLVPTVMGQTFFIDSAVQAT